MDSDGFVIDLYGVDDRAQIGLAERGFARRDPFAHESAESFDLVRFERDIGCRLDFGPLQRGLGALPVGFERGEPVPEHIVKIGDAILDYFVEPAELVVGLGDFALKDAGPSLDFSVAGGAFFGQ